ncbi:CPBP family intramembrane glutamic endopeptidase [Mucilaginibacter antarcticus]|uniref:CPBP family intramembrane glutamic endopeptidase n=1 Tax=Mucilaginibacter antarcticus TaxID=1855725 RepID=UPI0036343026
MPSLLIAAVGFFLSDGLLVEIAINWLLLILIETKGLGVLGLTPTPRRGVHLLAGFGIAAGMACFNWYLQTIFSGSVWSLNPSFTPARFLDGTWWTMQSVLYEELIFRAALLYIAINKIGVRGACWLSAICFGAYHWFSMNAFGNPVQMAFIFIVTGAMGYIFALAYAKTKSLYLPIALHFGWNFINTVIFSQGPIGNQLLILKRGELFNAYENTIVMLVQYVAFPALAYWYIVKRKPQVTEVSPPPPDAHHPPQDHSKIHQS